MSRRQFAALASVVADFADRIPDRLRWELADAIAAICRAENSRFDRGRFFCACSLDENRRDGKAVSA